MLRLNRKNVIIYLCITAAVLISVFSLNHFFQTGNSTFCSERSLSTTVKAIIANYDEVINEFTPIRFKRPVTTEEACLVFTHLLESGYFRSRFHGGDMDSPSYHKQLFRLSIPGEYSSDYGHTEVGYKNLNELSSNLKDVDRIAFYKHVAKKISPDKTVSNIKNWVAQNISPPLEPPAYSDGPGKIITDGVEVIFIGLGQCGQVNRVLLYLIKFGLGQEARLIGTPGHGFTEWKPKGGDYCILDADTVGKLAPLPFIPYEALIRDFSGYSRILDAQSGAKDFGHSVSSSYMQKDKGDAWFINYTYGVDSEGKIISKTSKKFPYYSIGREKCALINPKFVDKSTIAVTVTNCTIQGDFGIYAWILPKNTLEGFSTYDWVKDIISLGTTWITGRNSENLNGSIFHIKLSSPLESGRYQVLMAATKTGFDAFSDSFFTLNVE
jgi:hypothetical protein